MKPTDYDDPLGIHAETDRERRASPYRHRLSRERVHPIDHDIGCLVDFVTTRRSRQPGALDAARRVLKRVDIAAVRTLISIIRSDGSFDVTTRRRCDRVEGYCGAIEAALALKKELLELLTQDPEVTNYIQ